VFARNYGEKEGSQEFAGAVEEKGLK